MKPQEELDLILKLIKKYELPLSPILEYAINEKKEEFPYNVLRQKKVWDDINRNEKSSVIKDQQKFKKYIENKKKSQTKRLPLTKQTYMSEVNAQTDVCEKIDYDSHSEISNKEIVQLSNVEKGSLNSDIILTDSDNIETIQLVEFDSESRRKLLLQKMRSFAKARSPQYIANTIDPKEWGGLVDVEKIDTLLKLMPEVEYVPFGLYQLKR